MTTETEMLEELKKIREALAPTPPPPEPEKKKNLLMEFKDFIKKYKVLGLAVAFIMGIYLGALVKSLV
ncbi:MAG: MscL family protein, partial [Candidatus Hermodarchaeota archaeon]